MKVMFYLAHGPLDGEVQVEEIFDQNGVPEMPEFLDIELGDTTVLYADAKERALVKIEKVVTEAHVYSYVDPTKG